MSDSGKQDQVTSTSATPVSPSPDSPDQKGESLITPSCGRCNRSEPPMIIASEVVKQIERIMTYSDANFCCKVCGDVMSMEVQR